MICSIPSLREESTFLNGKPEQAASNSRDLLALLDNRIGSHLELRVVGNLYLDLSTGPILMRVGGRGQLAGMTLRGPGRIIGLNAPHPTTPVLHVLRAPGSIPHITLRDLTIESDKGSGILCTNGGALTLLEGVKFENIAGRGELDMEGFGDVHETRCGFALRVVDSDGLFVRRCAICNCGGHGVVCDRWHAGELQCYARECGGVGFKLQQANGLVLDARSESNFGYGLHIRDTGIDCYEARKRRANDGGPNAWRIWCEANNGRGITGSHGYRFSQLKFENVARCRITGHSGWQDNQVRLDACSRDQNEWVEDVGVPRRAPDRDLTRDIVLPVDGFGDRRVTNWDRVWPDERFRPRVTRRTKSSGVRISWPAGSLDHTAGQEVAYWNPFGLAPLWSPGTFVFSATARDASGAIAAYCSRREEGSPRQSPCVAVFVISPVAGAITGVSLWDPSPHVFSGSITVADVRTDIGMHINAWAPGMEGGFQEAEHDLEISELSLWKL